METTPTSNMGKVLHFPGKIFKALRGLPVVPTLVEVHPTQICNHACPHCVGWEEGKSQGRSAMSFDDFKNRIHDPYETMNPPDEEHAKRFSFSGETGDPLMCPDFFRMVEYSRIPFIVITNGYGEPDPVLLKAQGIRVSLDAVDGKKYGHKHGLKDGDRALERVLGHARRLAQWKRERASDASLGFGYLTGGDTTLEELRRAVSLAEDAGVDYINFRPFHGDAHALRAERAEILKAPRRVQILFADKYDHMETGDGAPGAQCHATRFLMVVAADLTAYSCCHFTGRKEYALGSLRDSTMPHMVSAACRDAARYPNEFCVPHCRGHRVNADVDRVAGVARYDPYL